MSLRRPALLVLLAAAAAATAASAPSAPARCGRASARAAVAATRLRLRLLGDSPVRVDPGSVDQAICFDFTRDGRVDVAATIASGGTAGDIGFAVFRRLARRWTLVLARAGYKLGLFRVGGDLVSSQPLYRRDDPNCCPTGGFDHVRFHWQGARVVVVRRWRSTSFRP